MEALIRASYLTTLPAPTKLSTPFSDKPISKFQLYPTPTSSFSPINAISPSKSKLFCTSLSTIRTANAPTESPAPETQDEKFDWYAQWYPVMPVCDLDKRVPHAKKVLGIDVVVWWDRNENSWKVFDDTCPHRLAPLSEGRIDQWGRLQCVYHGWCFNGSGDCKFIPQAPPDGPPIHTNKKACVAVYPSTVQHDIVWFWPNSDPQFQNIISKKKPPYIPELEDPSYTKLISNRDIPYGYEVLVENLMDPAHLTFLLRGPLTKLVCFTNKLDREGGRPLNIDIERMDIDGFTSRQQFGGSKFIPPCVYYAYPNKPSEQTNGSVPKSTDKKESSAVPIPKLALLIFICVPVSPGHSRLIWTFPRNFGVWIDKVVPRWMFHIGQNLILDSDLYLLHVEERKIMDAGPSNWQKACFVPTKSDANVIAFRKWLRKYASGQIHWGPKYGGSALPPTPPREQLLDRYWSHVVNCSSCSSAHKALNVLELALQVAAVGLIGFVAATRHNAMTTVTRSALVLLAILCFVASKWLSHFIYKTFHYHDYNHALR
uniref:Rieske domain-containing protein n=1 Tax=Kalanchoe fedtschenkoi TaxID=63787 RepID=A0A7N0T8J5_KALFE